MNLFGFGKKGQQAPKKTQSTPQDAIALLDSKIETLYKRDQFLNTKVQMCRREALEKKKKNDKTGALIALKKSNRYQEETKKLQGTIMNLENQKMALESATVNADVIKVLDSTNQTLKRALDDVTPEKVDEVIEDMEEVRDHQDQISEALTRNTEDMFDDEDLLAELDGLEEELEQVEEQEKAPTIPTRTQQQSTTVEQKTVNVPEAVFNFPNAPQGQIQQQTQEETEEERAMRELQESMLA